MNSNSLPMPPAKSPSDFMVQTATHTEMLSKEKAFALLDELIEKRAKDDFVLGAVLSRISDGCKVDKAWLEGYPTFTALVTGRFKYVYRSAKYLIDNYRYLVAKEIPADTMKGVGWTKLAVLVATKKLTKGNAAKWAKTAKKLSNKKLKAKVTGGKPKNTLTTHDGKVSPPVITTEKHEPKVITISKITYVHAEGNSTNPPNGMHAELKKTVKQIEKELRDEMAAVRDKAKAAFPDGDKAPMMWLECFEEGWPKVVVKVEFPVEFPVSSV